jgi:hypothetical protein
MGNLYNGQCAHGVAIGSKCERCEENKQLNDMAEMRKLKEENKRYKQALEHKLKGIQWCIANYSYGVLTALEQMQNELSQVLNNKE